VNCGNWALGTAIPYLTLLATIRYVCRSEKIHYKQVISLKNEYMRDLSCYHNKLLTSMCALKKNGEVRSQPYG